MRAVIDQCVGRPEGLLEEQRGKDAGEGDMSVADGRRIGQWHPLQSIKPCDHVSTAPELPYIALDKIKWDLAHVLMCTLAGIRQEERATWKDTHPTHDQQPGVLSRAKVRRVAAQLAPPNNEGKSHTALKPKPVAC